MFSRIKSLFFSNKPNLIEEIETVTNLSKDGFLLLDKNNQISWYNQNASEWLDLENKYARKNIRSYFSNQNFSAFIEDTDSEKTIEVIAPSDKE